MVEGVVTDEVRISLGERSYAVVVGPGLLDELGPRVANALHRPSTRAVVVTDSRVAPLYLPRVRSSLEGAGFAVVDVQIPEGEQHKNLAWLALLYDRLIEAAIDRTTPIIALGGGVVGDLAGFAAATILRGVPLVQVPTTLLAQVDASIGGKTGINHASGKNLIGAFHQPRLVVADVETLRTLPPREYRAGLAEVVKYGVILDATLFEQIERSVADCLRQDRELVRELVTRSCRLKAMVVEADESEGGFRAVLNFGHTVAHAIETLTEYRKFLHGEAVAIGMVAACRLSRRRGLVSAAEEQRLERVLGELDLPTEIPDDVGTEQLAIAIEIDKKAAQGKIRFVCVETIGKTRFEMLTAREIARAVRRG